MPPSSRSAVAESDPATPPSTDTAKWVDLEPPLRNSDGLLAIFSQCRWDGRITFSIQREFERYDRETGKTEILKTSFVPESLTGSYAAILEVATQHIEDLKLQRLAGKLPFPEGGMESDTKRRRRPPAG